MFMPLYFLGYTYYFVAPLGFAVAYLASFNVKFLAAWAAALAAAYLASSAQDPAYQLWLLVGSTIAAYLLALGLGRRGCRLVSLAVFWVAAQVAPLLVSLPVLLLLGPVFGQPLPNLWEYPLYIAVYWLIYQTHGRAVEWCQKKIEEPAPACWFNNEGS